MKVDKGLTGLMLSALGSSYGNVAVTNKDCIVISLWSGAELTNAEKTAIGNSVDASGLIPGNWTSNFTGRQELARLVLPNFADRALGTDISVDLNISKRDESFNFLAAGTCGAFSLFVCGNGFAGYNTNTSNLGRILFTGTVSNLSGSGDLKLNSTSITAQSRIRIPDVKMVFTYLNYVNTWSTGSGSGSGQTEDPMWSSTMFLVRLDDSLVEDKSGAVNAVTTGSISYVDNVVSGTAGDKSLVLNGSSWVDYSNVNLASNSPLTGDFTFECFVEVDSTQTTTGVIMGDQTNIYPQLIATIGTSIFQFRLSSSVVLQSLTKFVPGQMLHLAVQRRGTSLEMYVSGWRVGTTTYSASISLSTLRLGVGQSATDAFKGKIASFRYTKAARYSGFGFWPPLKQFGRYVEAETSPDFSKIKANFEFATDQKELISGASTTIFSQFSSPNVVTYDTYGAVFNKTAGLMIPAATVGLGITNKFTLEAFVISFGNSPYSGNIIGFGTSLSNCVGIYINGFNMYFQDRNSGFASGAGTLVNGQEHHIAHVYDGTKHMFFVDGRLLTSVTRALGTIASQQLYVGGIGTDNFNGKIRSARFSNDALYTANFVPTGRLFTPAV